MTSRDEAAEDDRERPTLGEHIDAAWEALWGDDRGVNPVVGVVLMVVLTIALALLAAWLLGLLR